MVELIRTDDPVLLSWLTVRLADLGLRALVFDGHTATAYGGALSSVRFRVMVDERDLIRASGVVAEANDLVAGAERVMLTDHG
jgi:hypothetical protein